MTRGLITLLLTSPLCLQAPAAAALELFGVDLAATDRAGLRTAVKQAGVELLREGGDETYFDVYDSTAVLDGSSRLYLGFVQASERFAFAEYEFYGTDTRIMLDRLRARYGDAEVRHGRYITDRSYRWRRDGIEIRLHSDWHNYRVRLSYTHPQNLAAMLDEKAAAAAADAATDSISLY